MLQSPHVVAIHGAKAGVLAPSKSRKIDGFHPAAALGGASAIFPDFFTTALVALVGRGSCA
ncbi:MAG: hypothetical protein ACK561_16195, partial [Pseudomonadaceae bacterium]